MNSVEKEAVNLVANGLANHALRMAVETLFPGALKRLRNKKVKEREAERWIGPVPRWVKTYVKKHGAGRIHSFTWRQSRTKAYSSGHCELWTGRIVVTAGNTSLGEQNHLIEKKGVVLHELAHATTMAGHGDPAFWNALYAMLVAENLYRTFLKIRPWGHGSLKVAARRARKERSG